MTENHDRTDALAADGRSSPTGRRPYRAPQLKYLGSVRDLTLGKTSGRKFDTSATKRP